MTPDERKERTRQRFTAIREGQRLGVPFSKLGDMPTMVPDSTQKIGEWTFGDSRRPPWVK